MAKAKVGILGLGIMGSAMAGNLLRAGFKVIGYDPVPACRSRLPAMADPMMPNPRIPTFDFAMLPP